MRLKSRTHMGNITKRGKVKASLVFSLHEALANLYLEKGCLVLLSSGTHSPRVSHICGYRLRYSSPVRD